MADEGKTATTEAGTAAAGGVGAASVPEDLQKFVGTDGKLDVTRVSQAYLESEKKATQEAQKRAEAERAYQMAVTGLGDFVPAKAGAAGDGRGSDTRPDVDDDDPVTNKSAKPIVQTLLVLAHPELEMNAETGEPKNPKFYDGLFKYMKGLPAGTRQAIANGDFQMVEWAVREYKALSKTSASAQIGGGGGGLKPNFVEGGSPAGGAPAGTVYSRSEMRNKMLQNPVEYAKLSEDYGKAISEGRVKE